MDAIGAASHLVQTSLNNKANRYAFKMELMSSSPSRWGRQTSGDSGTTRESDIALMMRTGSVRSGKKKRRSMSVGVRLRSEAYHGSPRSSAHALGVAATAFEDGEQIVDPDVVGGIVTDFLCRARRVHGKETYRIEGCYTVEELVLRDLLSSTLLQEITNALKDAPGGWPKTTIARFVHRSRRIRESVRESICLRTEVAVNTGLKRLVHSHVSGEDQRHRKTRLEEFFGDYSKRDWDPLMKHQNARGSPGVQVVPKMPRRREPYRQDQDAWEEVEEETEQLPPVQPPERLRRNMIWSPEQGRMVWTIVDPQPGTRAAKALEKSTGLPPSLWDAAETNVKKSLSMQWIVKSSSPLGASIPRGSPQVATLQRSASLGRTTSSVLLPSWSQAGRRSRGPAAAATVAWALPPLPSPCKSVKHRLDSTNCQRRYFQTCRDFGMAPAPELLMTGHTSKLDGVGRQLTDRQVLAIADVVPASECIEEVNLGGCNMLTDASLVPLMSALMRRVGDETLHTLSLEGCCKAGQPTLQAFVHVLESTACLRTLNIGGVAVATRLQLALCQAVGQHGCLETADLSETGLGSGNAQAEQKCIEAFMVSKTVRKLSLSGNSFSKEAFTLLGQRLITNNSLVSLSLARCSSPTIWGETSITFFVECIAYEDRLTYLDAGMNGISAAAALVFEDSLANHRRLTELDMSGNHLGVLGLRTVLRLLSYDTSGILQMHTEGCYLHGPGASYGAQVFRLTNPSGRYKLNLSRPTDRSLLRMLYKVGEHVGIAPEAAFEKVVYSEPPFTHATKSHQGVWQVPTSGTLTVNYNMELGMETLAKGVNDGDFCLWITKYYEMVRAYPSFRKSVPLCAKWNELKNNNSARQIFLEALSKDFNLSMGQVRTIVRASFDSPVDIIWRLLPCILGEEELVEDGETRSNRMVSRSLARNRSSPKASCERFSRPSGAQAINYLAQMLCSHVPDFLLARTRLSRFLDFNVDNPTGRYRLDLSNPAEHAVAERLFLLDRWETCCAKRNGRVDASSRGDGSFTRNEYWQDRELYPVVGRIAEWILPEHDVLELDYVSGQRPPVVGQVLDDDTFDDFLTELHYSECPPGDKISVLRTLSHHLHITAMQMRSMLGFFKEQEHRADAFVTFYMRIMDMYNSKVFTVRFDTQAEVVALMNRLGYITFFPFIQPENLRFALNFAVHEQKVCANMIVALAQKEKAGNIRDPLYVLPDGKVDPLPLGVPRTWEFIEKAPNAGVFSGYYVCAPEDRKFDYRLKLWDTYTRFNSLILEDGGTRPLHEGDVMWWTGLTEAPEDIIKLLEFFISRVPDVGTAFTMIDGEGGNGVITLGEFRDGLQAMGFRKFKDGGNEAARIEATFRHLDPGCEGSVSREEWKVLDQLWNEFDLCIRDFTQFLMRTFGEDLMVAWEYVDSDRSGELTEEEWCEAVANLGYFGPSRVVFALLDGSDDGNISRDEFEALNMYKDKRRRSPEND